MLSRCNEKIARHSHLAGGVLVLIMFAVFRRALAGGFVFDDIPHILQNSYFATPYYWFRVFSGATDPFPDWKFHAGYYRPLQFFLYWAFDRLAGLNPQAFHLFQLCLCAVTVWLVFLVGRELLGNDLAAFAGALLWGLHPLHVQVVSWIAALNDAGVGFCVMGSFWLFLRAEKEPGHRLAHHVRAALVYTLALFFKETALVFPLLLAAYWLLLGTPEPWLGRWRRGWPYVLAAAGYVAVRMAVLGRFWTAHATYKLSPRVVGISVAALGEHARLFLWPVNLTPARTFDFSSTLRSPWPWLTLAALGIVCVLRKRQRLVAFLAAWWLIALLPCLDLRQLLGFPIQDNYSYLPSVGPCLAIAFAALVLAPQRVPRLNIAWIPITALIAGLWTVQDIRNVPNWYDDAALWNHAARAAPDSALAHLFRAIVLERQTGDLDGAAREYQTTLRLNEVSFLPTAGMVYECYLGLGRIALMKGHSQEAVAQFEKAVHLAPGLSPAYRALGVLYFPRGDYAKSAQYFVRVVKMTPDDVEARFFLGTCWMKLGKPADAAAQFHAARQVDPSYIQAFRAEAVALEAAGDKDGAARVRQEIPLR